MQAELRTTHAGGGFRTLLQRGLTYRYLPVALAMLAVALTAVSLGAGLSLDDYVHRGVILGAGRYSEFYDSSLDIFRFIDGDRERTARLMDLGVLPWWTYEDIRGAFWRPVVAVTHWLDYQLWPKSPALMHGHNLFWFGLLIAAVTLMYRRFMGMTVVAGLAALLYAVEDTHGMPVSFVANRNVLLSTLFCVLALMAHDRWRRDGWRMGAVAGPLLLAVSLLAKEAGVATCAYLVGYALFLDRGGWRQRIGSLVPYTCVVVIWRLVWTHLGYGVEGIGIYADPISETAYFLRAALERGPFFLMGQWLGVPAQISVVLEFEQMAWVWAGVVIFLLLLTLVLRPLWRRDRLARFWAFGMMASVVPICAAVAWDRMLFFVGLGAMGLLSQFFAAAFGRSAARSANRVGRVAVVSLAVLFVVIHLIVAPILLPMRAIYPLGSKEAHDMLFVNTPMDESVMEQDVIVVNPPLALPVAFLPLIRDCQGLPSPRRVRVLAPGALNTLFIQRVDARTLLIRLDKSYTVFLMDRLFRDDRNPMPQGYRVELAGMMVEVTEVNDLGRPTEARFEFAVPLEDASLRWLQFKDREFVPFQPPAIGQSVELPSMY